MVLVGLGGVVIVGVITLVCLGSGLLGCSGYYGGSRLEVLLVLLTFIVVRALLCE